MAEPVTLAKLSVTNFRGIAKADVTFTGGTVYISGQNEAGKSSFADAVATLFFGVDYAGKIPLRKGEKRGELVGTLSNGLTARMGITENGMTELRVTDASGLKLGTPRAILDKLVGDLAFDPLRFVTELDAKSQLAELKKITGLDFTKQDAERAAKYSRRTDVNREAKSAAAAVEQAAPHDETAPSEEIQVADLMLSLKAAQDHNATLEKHAANIVSGEAVLLRLQQRIAEIEAELAKEKERATAYSLALADLKAKPVAITADTAAIEQQIANSGAENRKLSNNRRRAELEATAKKWADESAKLTAEIEAIDAAKAAAIQAARMPIDGLSISDDGVVFDGIPLSQLATKQQIEISFAICASLNPTLRCVIIKHGSLITPSNRPHFEELASRYGMQPLVELADESGTVPGIVIVDGRVAGAVEPEPTVKPVIDLQLHTTPAEGPFATA